MIWIESKKHKQFKMSKLSLLDDLIDLKQFKSIESNKIHNFLNTYDKNKTRKEKILLFNLNTLTKE